MPAVNVVDESFVVADPDDVRAVVCDVERWASWLPGVRLTPYQDRGPLGVRWHVSGVLTGTAEVWLEEHGDGTVVHAYLRADPTGLREGRRERRRRLTTRRIAARYALPLKRGVREAKDLLEGNREPGSTRVPLGERVVSASDGGQAGGRPNPQAAAGPEERAAGTRSEGTAPDGRSDHLEHPDRR